MKCFIIMPYGNGLKDAAARAQLDLLHEHIRDAVESLAIGGNAQGAIECIRGDREARPGEIVRGVVRDLVDSEFAIAVLTGHNPNVFYELGVRHAVRNNTILLAERESDVPFDLRTQRLILYSTASFADARELTRKIQQGIRQMLPLVPRELSRHDGGEPDNPVLRYLTERWPSSPAVDEHRFTGELRMLRKLVEQLILDRPTAREARGEPLAHRMATDGGWGDFLGNWFREEGGGERSHFYVRTVHGVPIVLYSFMGNRSATGIYFNLSRSSGRIYGRFRWLDIEDMRGYAVLTVESQDRVSGGWWFDDLVPEDVRRGAAAVSPDHPGMNPMVWIRSTEKSVPGWVEKWFALAEINPQTLGIC